MVGDTVKFQKSIIRGLMLALTLAATPQIAAGQSVPAKPSEPGTGGALSQLIGPKVVTCMWRDGGCSQEIEPDTYRCIAASRSIQKFKTMPPPRTARLAESLISSAIEGGSDSCRRNSDGGWLYYRKLLTLAGL